MIQDQTVPFNLEAEQALLAELLFDNQVLVRIADLVTADDFFEAIHQEIFRLVEAAMAQGIRATAITLKDHLLGDLGHGMKQWEYVSRLLTMVAGTRHVESHAKVVHSLAVRRRLMSIASDLSEAARTMTMSDQPEDLARDTIAAIHESTAVKNMGGRPEHVSALGTSLMQHIAAKLSGDIPDAPTTGLPDLDKAIGGGLLPKRLIVVAARPAMGKTSVACSCARRSAKAGNGTLLFSIEIPKSEIMARIVSDEMATSTEILRKVEFVRVMNGWLKDQTEHEAVGLAVREINRYPIVVDDTSSLTMAEIEVRTRMVMDDMARKGQQLRSVWIDYLQRIKPAKDYAGNRVEELGQITLHCKEMAKRLDVSVVLFSQLNRGVENRDEKRPQVSDLRGSGEVEEHADVVALLYREAFYLEKSAEYQRGDPGAISVYLQKQHDLEIILGKNRLGPVRTVEAFADVKFSSVQSKALL